MGGVKVLTTGVLRNPERRHRCQTNEKRLNEIIHYKQEIKKKILLNMNVHQFNMTGSGIMRILTSSQDDFFQLQKEFISRLMFHLCIILRVINI